MSMPPSQPKNLELEATDRCSSISPFDIDDKNNRCKATLSAMMSQEKHYKCTPLRQTTTSTRTRSNAKSNINNMKIFRTKIFTWMMHIIDTAQLQRETAIIAMSYLDRFMSTTAPQAKRARYNRRQYQLISFTCLYIAIKISEPTALSISMCSTLSRGVHSIDDIIACEKNILKGLKWRMNGPTPHQFVHHMLQLLPNEDKDTSSSRSVVASKVYADSQSEIEIAVEDYACVSLRSSSIAVAALLNSLDTLPQDTLSCDKKIHFIQIISDTLGIDVSNSPLVMACRQRFRDRSTKSLISRRVHVVPTNQEVVQEEAAPTYKIVPTSTVDHSPLFVLLEKSHHDTFMRDNSQEGIFPYNIDLLNS